MCCSTFIERLADHYILQPIMKKIQKKILVFGLCAIGVALNILFLWYLSGPMPDMDISYYVDKHNVRIDRAIRNRQSYYKIYRGDKFLGEFYWDNNTRLRTGYKTDTGTWYQILVSKDSIYLLGEAWKKDYNETTDSSVVIAWYNKPNAYYELSTYNTQHEGRERYSYTERLDKMMFEKTEEYTTIKLKLYFNSEVEEEYNRGIYSAIVR